MVTEKQIIDAYLFLRKKNHSLPDEVLEFMKKAALQKLKELESV